MYLLFVMFIFSIMLWGTFIWPLHKFQDLFWNSNLTVLLIGIPSDEQEAIFKRFIQADIASRQARQGSGLGLSIAKAFLGLFGGKIWVESESGKGSIFRFTIPYHNGIEEKKQVFVINEDKIYQSEKLKILVVDDDNTSRMLLKFMINPLTKDILQAINGREAIETCRNNPDIDLVMMDIQMLYFEWAWSNPSDSDVKQKGSYCRTNGICTVWRLGESIGGGL